MSELLFGFLLSQRSGERIRYGFLVKNGNDYVIAWKRGHDFIRSQSYASLNGALTFAREDLRLSESNNPMVPPQVQHVWVEAHAGDYRVFWKGNDLFKPHHLTFRRLSDAVYFANAFRQGDYSGSPLGHSVYLGPVRAE